MKTYRKKQPAQHQSLFRAGLPLRRALNLAILTALYPSFSYANPDGAQIVSGQVSIDTATPGVTTVTNSPNAIINWQNFSIAQNELTQFIQQNGQSAVLNRIIGQNPSEILGQLTSNGKVFLINPNGIVFGAGSTVDTQGLIASSLNLSDQDFLSGNYHFMAGSSAGNILNEGIIRAGKDGNIILIAPQIENNGIIKSDGGSITLAAGQELTITNLDSPDIRFQIQAPADSVLNLGKLLTEGGAINVFANTIKHSGEINADSVQIDKQGHIQLVAQQDITLASGSKISANNSRGDAGTIHIDSKTGTTLAQGTIEAQATQTGKGGNIELLGERVGVLDQASIDASGENGGGQALIGGDYQGKNAKIHNAKAAYIGKETTIKADAKTHGDGGKAIAWSDDATRAYGDISAKGGSLSGNGGFIETSGHWLDTAGIRINASAPHGQSGNWLLDPYNITIVADLTDVSAVTDPFISYPDWTATSASSYLRNSAINTQLDNGTSISIYTGGATGADAGNITVAANISKNSGGDATLNLKADNAVIINSDIDIRSISNKLNVILNADADGSGTGYIQMNAGSSINSNGGDITLGGGVNPLATPARGDAGNPDGVQIYNAIIDAGAGNINIRGTGIDGTYGASGIRIDSLSQLISTTGNISLTGTGGNGTDWNMGVELNNSTLTTDGAISITGTGQGSGSSTKGVYLYGAQVTSSGNLNITANGSGPAGDLMQADGGMISNLGANRLASGNSDVTLSGNNLTLIDVRSQHHIVLNALGDVSLGLPATNDYVDDQYFIYNLPFTFTFFGSPYSQAYISSNGLITFGSGTTDYADSTVALGAYRAIAPAWNDWELHTSSGKNIFISRPTAADLAVQWNVERYNNTGNTAIFETVLNSAGNITFNYGAANNSFAGDVTIGLSDGTSAITSQLMTGFTSLNNLNSTTFTPFSSSYTENVASTGGMLAGTTPVYTGNTGFNISANNAALSALANITVNAGGSITQNDALASSNGGNIILAADGNYINDVGSNAFNISGSGRWLIYSTDPASNTLGGLTPSFKHYGCQYATGCTGYSIPSTGNGVLYSITPVLYVTPGTAGTSYGSSVSLAGLGYTLSGYIDGDTAADANIGGTAGFSTNATASSSAGTYNITYNGGLSNNLGYAVSDNTASVAEYTITPALLTLSVTADNATRVYGDANPVFTGNITAGGLANGDTLSSIGLIYTTLATRFSNVGAYSITPKITSSNYAFTGIDGQLAVTPRSLTVTAIAADKTFGALDPVLAYNATGFVNGESSSILTGALTRETGETVAGGPYAINQGSLANSNYSITYTGADFTINPAELNITANNLSKTYGALDPVLTYNATGFVNGESSSILTGALTRKTGETVAGGPYAINQGSLANSNYSITYTGADFTINPLTSVDWVGGNGDWSTASNWANNILPTTGNVLAAAIPTGVTVTYDATAGNTYLDNLNSLGHFQIIGGSLGVGGKFSTAQYSQSGGALSADSFYADNAFTQTGGVLTANNISLNTIGDLIQGAWGNINAISLKANSGGDVTLAGLNNITGVLDITAGNDIYSRTVGVSRIGSLNAPNGWIDVENVGGFILGSTVLNQGATVANAAGDIVIKAKSPLTINGAVSSTSGSVNLTASNGDTLSINAPISAPKGVTLAGGTLTGNNAGSYIRYFNNATPSENVVTNSTETVTAGVLGSTPQSGLPLVDESSSNNDSLSTSADPNAEKDKKLTQCTK